MQRLEAVRRPRLDDIKQAEQQKTNDGSGDVDGQERERDQHPYDFIEDDRRRIDTAEMSLRGVSAPHTNSEQEDDDRQFQSRRT